MLRNIKTPIIVTILITLLISTFSLIFLNQKVFATPSPVISFNPRTNTSYLNSNNGEIDIAIKLNTDSVNIDHVNILLTLCGNHEFKDYDTSTTGTQAFNTNNSSFTTINTNKLVIYPQGEDTCRNITLDATGSVNGSAITVAEITIEPSKADDSIYLEWGSYTISQSGTSLLIEPPIKGEYEAIAEGDLNLESSNFGYGFDNSTEKNDFTTNLYVNSDYATIEDALAEISYNSSEVEIISIDNGDAFTTITSTDDGAGTATIEATGETFNNNSNDSIFATITFRPKTNNNISVTIENSSYLKQADGYDVLNTIINDPFTHKDAYLSINSTNSSYGTNQLINTKLNVNARNTEISNIKAVIEYDTTYLRLFGYSDGNLGSITVDHSTPGILIIESDGWAPQTINDTEEYFADITFESKNLTTQGVTPNCETGPNKTGICLNTDLDNSVITATQLGNNILSSKIEKAIEITSLANMTLTSTQTDYKVNDTIPITIEINSEGTIISEATAVITYDTEKFELIGTIDNSNGVMENYPTKITNPGLILVTGKNQTSPEAENGVLAEFTLRALETTEGNSSTINIETGSETSQIIEDSSGTNILNSSEVGGIDINTIAEAKLSLSASEETIQPLGENIPILLRLNTDSSNISSFQTYIKYDPKVFEFTNSTNDAFPEWVLNTELIEKENYNYIHITGQVSDAPFTSSINSNIVTLDFTTLSTTAGTLIELIETPDGETPSHITEYNTNYNVDQSNYNTILETEYQYELTASPTMSITSADGETEKHLETEFDININFNPDKTTFSEVQTILHYDPEFVSYEGFNNSDIFENYTVSNDTATGTVTLVGSSSNPLYTGNSTELLNTLTFKPKTTTTSHEFSLSEPDTKIIETHTNTELSPNIPGTLNYTFISIPSFHMNPDNAKYQINKEFNLDINLLTDNSNIKEATAIIDYDSSLLQFQSFTNGNISNMTYSTSSDDTTITITGTTDSNGFQGENLFGKIKFKTINNGTTNLTFNSSSEIIENITGSPDIISLSDCTNSNITITAGASISSTSTNNTYEKNSTFSNSITLNTNGVTAESLNMTLNYNSDILSIESYNTSSTFSNCTITNNPGTFKLENCTGNYNGSNISVVSLTLKGIAVGTSNLAFDESTTILGEDGTGTNILHTFNDNSYTIYDSGGSVADLNSDGYVRQDDFTIWFNYYMSDNIEGDLNGDGNITQADFTVFYQEYLRLNN